MKKKKYYSLIILGEILLVVGILLGIRGKVASKTESPVQNITERDYKTYKSVDKYEMPEKAINEGPDAKNEIAGDTSEEEDYYEVRKKYEKASDSEEIRYKLMILDMKQVRKLILEKKYEEAEKILDGLFVDEEFVENLFDKKFYSFSDSNLVYEMIGPNKKKILPDNGKLFCADSLGIMLIFYYYDENGTENRYDFFQFNAYDFDDKTTYTFANCTMDGHIYDLEETEKGISNHVDLR